MKFRDYLPSFHSRTDLSKTAKRLMRVFAVIVMMFVAISYADATTYTFIVRPNQSTNITGRRIYNTYTGDHIQLGLQYIFAETYSIQSSKAQIATGIIKSATAEGNIWLRNVQNNLEMLLSQDGKTTDSQGTAKFTIALADSGDSEHNGKWKVTKVVIRSVNVRAANEEYDTKNPSFPCALTINGLTQELSAEGELQYVEYEFPEEQQWTDNLELFADWYSEIAIRSITLYVDDTEGFDTIDPEASRIASNTSGEYSLPNPQTGNMDFSGYFRLNLLDEQNATVNYSSSVTTEGFSIYPASTSDDGIPEGLDAGRYYAVYGVSSSDISLPLTKEDGIPFEILPTLDGFSINYALVERAGGKIYTCAPHPEINRTTSATDSVTHTWNNAFIGGLQYGTKFYWKHLTDEEVEAFKSNRMSEKSQVVSDMKRRQIIRKETAIVPEGYSLYSHSTGLDLTNGGENGDSGAVGVVLARNGVVSDPVMVEFTKGQPIPTGINTIEANIVVKEVYYTLDGIRINPDNLKSKRPLIKVTIYTDGRTVSSRIL